MAESRSHNGSTPASALGNASLYPTIMARDGVVFASGCNSLEIKLLLSPLMLTAAIRFFIVYELAPNVRAGAIEQLRRWISERRLRHAVAARYR
jgi:NADPH:quinone reductase